MENFAVLWQDYNVLIVVTFFGLLGGLVKLISRIEWRFTAKHTPKK